MWFCIENAFGASLVNLKELDFVSLESTEGVKKDPQPDKVIFYMKSGNWHQVFINPDDYNKLLGTLGEML